MMGGACGRNGEEGEVHTVFWWGNMRARYYSEDLNIDVRILLKCTRMGDVEWTHEMHDRTREVSCKRE
jgi:hypothetical protein